MAQLAECLQFKYKELNLSPRSHVIIQVPWLALIAPVLERRDKRSLWCPGQVAEYPEQALGH